jgi:hypothetical protein
MEFIKECVTLFGKVLIGQVIVFMALFGIFFVLGLMLAILGAIIS